MKPVRTVKQYSTKLDTAMLCELSLLLHRYSKVKNYVYSRYSGVNSLTLLNRHRQLIRDKWIKEGLQRQWGLPTNYVYAAIDDAVSDLVGGWVILKGKVKKAVSNNKNLTNDDLHFIRYVLKVDTLYQSILTRNHYTIPEQFVGKAIRFKQIENLICRLTRRYKAKLANSNGLNSMRINPSCYRFVSNYLSIAGFKANRTLRIEVLGGLKYSKGDICLVLRGDRVEIHKSYGVKIKSGYNTMDIVGVDLGYRTMIVSSSGNEYGVGLNNLIDTEQTRLAQKNKERYRLIALERKHRALGNLDKAENIRKNNLGLTKYKRQAQNYQSRVKSLINSELNRFLKSEKPQEIVMENLGFVSKKRFRRRINRNLNRWMKGYIKDRIKFKTSLLDIKLTFVNPAYTSQECSNCGKLGVRKGEKFRCNHCNHIDNADKNAAKVIKTRRDISDITLYTPYLKVKELIMTR